METKCLRGREAGLLETETGGVRHLGDGLCRDLGFRLHSEAGEKKQLETGVALFSSILHPVFRVCISVSGFTQLQCPQKVGVFWKMGTLSVCQVVL